MALNKKLATMSVAALAVTTPGLAEQKSAAETEPAPAVQQAETHWYQSAWKYTGGMLGEGISYAGKGVSKAGEGISWTFDKAMWPVRKTGEGINKIGKFLEKGPEWVEKNTGLPMETAKSIIGTPFGFVYSITDNASDLTKELPLYGLGMAGSTVSLTGKTIAADTNGMATATKDLGSNAWGTTKTMAGDALPLALQATGIGGVAMNLPYMAITRDAFAAAHRTTDLVTGQTDLSKSLPTDVLEMGKYTYDRVRYGKTTADINGGRLFVSAANEPSTAHSKALDPNIQRAMIAKAQNRR
ncbi:MAG: hypothetical protein IJV07_01445 [Alphaproteobacteria bacterium]|nr:hypothetical protein [Alphaproteobacteria bacterium]